MSTIEKIAGGMFLLIMAYLIFTSRGYFNVIVGSIGRAVTNTTLALQGRG